MKLLSVNVSLPREIHHNRKTVTTGIFKQPLDGRVALRQMNLDGDGQADLVAHGGIYKAAYVYSIENYDHWKKELRQDDFTMGQFGENFTVVWRCWSLHETSSRPFSSSYWRTSCLAHPTSWTHFTAHFG